MTKKKKVSAKFDEADVRSSYQKTESVFRVLCGEAKFILEKRLGETEIKIHAIEDRVKSIDSLIKKAQRIESASPLDQIHDIVGLRIICLFRHDLPQIGELIEKNFQIISKDDKTESGEVLGYQSVHYFCALPKMLTGARYEQITKRPFEIQVRTLCMHCWATVSHYIDYKGDWDVPKELKTALNALSGLFYVADNEFQQFYLERLKSKELAESAQADSEEQDINFDTVVALLKSKFPDRDESTSDLQSALVRELVDIGYKSISQVEKDIDRARTTLKKFEKDHPLVGGGKYTMLGAARVSLGLASDEFWAYLGPKRKAVRDVDPLEGYRKFVPK